MSCAHGPTGSPCSSGGKGGATCAQLAEPDASPVARCTVCGPNAVHCALVGKYDKVNRFDEATGYRSCPPAGAQPPLARAVSRASQAACLHDVRPLCPPPQRVKVCRLHLEAEWVQMPGHHTLQRFWCEAAPAEHAFLAAAPAPPQSPTPTDPPDVLQPAVQRFPPTRQASCFAPHVCACKGLLSTGRQTAAWHRYCKVASPAPLHPACSFDNRQR